jgi:hypothetical protein
MSRMRLLIVSGRTASRAATATWGRARRWRRVAARSRYVPLARGQPGQGRVAQPGQAGTGLAKGIRGTADLVVCLRAEGVVPVAVPVVAGQR